MPQRTIDLDHLHLQTGSHRNWEHGACLMEAVAYIAGERWTAHPECVCPTLGAFGRAWNDALPDADRDRILKPFIPKLIGTRSSPEVQDARAFMACDWAVRTYSPVWLRAAGLDAEAAELEGLPALSSVPLCRAAMPVIDRAKVFARAAAGAAAGVAAGDAAWAAAWDAAWAAAWAAAGVAAGDAAGDAAGAAAGVAAGDAARDAAWAAAGDAARDAAWAAAGAAAGDAAWAAAGDAAWAAAGAALRPPVELLQTSAADLFQRMIDITEVAA